MIDMREKSIAVVGNAESIIGASFGAEIDEHDIVIRMNGGVPDYHTIPHIGCKTELLAIASSNVYRGPQSVWFACVVDAYRALNIESGLAPMNHVLFSQPESMWEPEFADGFRDVEVTLVPAEVIAGLLEINKKPHTTGAAVLAWLIWRRGQLGWARFDVYAMDFFRTGDWTVTSRIRKSSRAGETKEDRLYYRNHNMEGEESWFKSELAQCPDIRWRKP